MEEVLSCPINSMHTLRPNLLMYLQTSVYEYIIKQFEKKVLYIINIK
jgi:hypothetical protein